MKKSFTQLFALLMLLAFSNGVFAEGNTTLGYSTSDEVTPITINGVLYNQNTGEVIGGDPLKDGVLVIPENVVIKGKTFIVTSIGDSAFYDRSDIEEIQLPKSLKQIRYSAFEHCLSLKSVVLPENVEKVEGAAFYDCRYLESFTFNNKVKEISDFVFYNDLSLTSIVFPENLEKIGYLSFYHCESLKELVIPDKVYEIERYAFEGCTRLAKITLPTSIKTLGRGVFGDCIKLRSIIFKGTQPPKIYDGPFIEFKDAYKDIFCTHDNTYFYGHEELSSLYKECTIYVPEGLEEVYQNSVLWNNFSIVVVSEIHNIFSSHSGNEINVIYNSDGRLVPTIQKGLNIIRYNNGKTKKIMR